MAGSMVIIEINVSLDLYPAKLVESFTDLAFFSSEPAAGFTWVHRPTGKKKYQIRICLHANKKEISLETLA